MAKYKAGDNFYVPANGYIVYIDQETEYGYDAEWHHEGVFLRAGYISIIGLNDAITKNQLIQFKTEKDLLILRLKT